MFGIDDAISGAISAGGDIINNIINKVAPDANEVEKNKMEQALRLMQNEHDQVVAQLNINAIEAASSDFRIAGWRPAVGWVSVFGLAYQLVVSPILNGILMIFGLPAVFVSIDISLLQTLIGGLTGLVISRSYDKKNNTDTKTFTSK